MAFKQPPIKLPDRNLPVVMSPDDLRMATAWYAFFVDLTSPASPIEPTTLGASPFVYTAVHPGTLFINGGDISAITLTRGRLTINLWPASFSVYLGSDQGSVADNTFTKVAVDTETWDDGSNFDAVSNHRWTPPAGLVELIGMISVTLPADGAIAIPSIFKNGSELKRGNIAVIGAIANPSVGVVAIDKANGTDYYELFALATGGGTHTFKSGSTMTYFQGYTLNAYPSLIPLSQNDEVTITYAAAPQMWYLPVGVPA